tara:strand:+ start:264 stop:422 length:159 start_codon:yes stop_codon:yes gene_type:complete
MLKMEFNEVATLLTIIENGTFQGKDIPIMAMIVEKLQTEAKKLGEKLTNGQK